MARIVNVARALVIMGAVAAASALAGKDAAMARTTYLYVGAYTSKQPGPGTEHVNPNGLSVFRLDPVSGALVPVQEVKTADPSYVALNPLLPVLYVNNEVAQYQGAAGSSIETYAIDRNAGTLSLLDRQSLTGPIPSQLAVSPDGQYVVVSIFGGGKYVVLPILPDGRLGAVSDSFQNVGQGPDKVRQTSAHPHSVVFDPTGRFFIGADLSLDKIQSFHVAAGKLSQVSEATVAPGAGPRHAIFGLNATRIYVVNELNASVSVFPFDPQTGLIGKQLQNISTYPDDYKGFRNAAEVAVHPSGKFLFASNRANAGIATFRIAEKTGLLSVVGYTTKGIDFPRSFTVDPSGKWLYVGNQTVDSVTRFAIDAATGSLSLSAEVTPTKTPVVLVFGSPQ